MDTPFRITLLCDADRAARNTIPSTVRREYTLEELEDMYFDFVVNMRGR